MLLNYGEPNWPKDAKDADKQAAAARLKKYGDRFVGYVSGESIAHASLDSAALDEKIKAAKSRADVLAALREANTAAVVKKFSGYAARTLTPEQAWAPVISCLSANIEAYAHALAAWGCRHIGHENTGNSPTLARRLAFLRGAARQFGAKVADYQSCNLGDSATMFSREAFFYPASQPLRPRQPVRRLGRRRRQLGAQGLPPVPPGRRRRLLQRGGRRHLLEARRQLRRRRLPRPALPQGQGDRGGHEPRSQAPRGVAVHAGRLPAGRGARLGAGALHARRRSASTRSSTRRVLTPGRHEDAVRGWFDVAYYPAPETQNEPATAVRQTYVNGIFGDIFDVIVTAPKHADILKTYPVVIAAGDVPLTAEWGTALNDYMEAGGTLVVCDGSFSGPGSSVLRLPAVNGPVGVLRRRDELRLEAHRRSGPVQRLPLSPPCAAGESDRVLRRPPDGAADRPRPPARARAA